MTSVRPLFRKLVVISRAGWILEGGEKRFQDNDGRYLDGLARFFEQVIIIAREFANDGTTVNYGFRFSSHNIQLVHGMESLIVSRPFRTLARIWKAMFEIAGADVVFSFVNTARGSVYLLLARILGKKTIAYCGTDRDALFRSEGRSRVQRHLFLWLEHLAMHHAHLRVVTGPRLFAKYKPHGLTTMTAPVSPLLTFASPARELPTYGSARPFRLLCVAHLRRQKNLECILEAAKLLQQSGADFYLTIVGDGDRRRALEALTSELGLEDRVRFHGYVNNPQELARLYESHEFFLFASTVEGFPRAIWEAIHFELYVVCVKVGGIEELFGNGEVQIVPYPDPKLLASSIVEATRHPKTTRTATESAKRKMRSLFPQDAINQIEEFLIALKAQ
ncbi:glycosyl transferase [Sulfurifustis variabilis]|uniref:Glycosyl transferase n=1 Tax=Sulfurifustis variabilis TaxID=1675686 RepID=A0A1B4V390_9GAMM|nr:glycosyltransferase [Sulfurifustis variabilis]BAU48030.1 glycosyl transferase [Sulfurifustis variabilis]